MKLSAKFFLNTVAILLLALLVGCAGSRATGEDSETAGSQDEYGEIEQLLGISTEDQNRTTAPSQPQTTPQDDNLLELLQGNDYSAPPTESRPAETPRPASQSEMGRLERKVSELQQELKEKNKTISVLRAQVMSMEEGQRKTPSRSASSYTGTMAAPSGDYERDYQRALQMAENRQYRDAIRAFESLLAANTQHSLSDNAQYWIGECYYALGDYRAAIMAFEKVFTFKNSNKNDYAQYKLGLCYYQLKDRERAQQEFQTLIDNYKNSMLISKAQQYMAKL